MVFRPVPDHITNEWKSPPRGYADRNPGLILRLEADFPAAPTAGAIEVWTLLRMIEALLGDHAVTLDVESLPSTGPLHAVGLPWRSGEYSTTLKAPLSWFTRKSHWEELAPISDTWWWIKAHRGGGAHRHEVWNLETHPAGRPLSMELALRHVAPSAFGDLNTLVSSFFQRVARAGSYYGRGGIIEIKDVFWPRFDSKLEERLWEESERLVRPIVPGVYRYNFLDRSRLERLGTPDLPPELLKDVADCLPTLVPIGDGALVVTSRPLDQWDASEGHYPDPIVYSTHEALFLLSEFARRGMLSCQNMDWVARDLVEIDRQRKLPAVPTPTPARRNAQDRQRWRALRDAVPRVIQGVGLKAPAAQRARGRRSGGHGSKASTEFVITAQGGAALPVYGVITEDDARVAPPLRVGSIRAERAAFEFDALRHGWDGEQRKADFPPEPRRLGQAKCPRCDGRKFELKVAFEYPDDLFDEGVLTPEELKRPEDFFTWFWMEGRCPACHWKGLLADVECA